MKSLTYLAPGLLVLASACSSGGSDSTPRTSTTCSGALSGEWMVTSAPAVDGATELGDPCNGPTGLEAFTLRLGPCFEPEPGLEVYEVDKDGIAESGLGALYLIDEDLFIFSGTFYDSGLDRSFSLTMAFLDARPASAGRFEALVDMAIYEGDRVVEVQDSSGAFTYEIEDGAVPTCSGPFIFIGLRPGSAPESTALAGTYTGVWSRDDGIPIPVTLLVTESSMRLLDSADASLHGLEAPVSPAGVIDVRMFGAHGTVLGELLGRVRPDGELRARLWIVEETTGDVQLGMLRATLH